MKRFTEKYVRTNSQWVKISRDNEKRTFTFARGFANQFQAHDVHTLPFKFVANWSEATSRAEQLIAIYS